ncbi:MAG: hypothetical protein UX44_C0004G0012 [candidate division WWE3 bacterium GW2011_GWA1_46_21]|uniref:Uncharacterized protein n=3 Tax=Katanobacteria TaxID=422282 RepID=A0A0G1RNX0_UNCKA|nr:MAG: hypothetical protein UX44_C0004G0012 [candidate division WWE3 bacterium GW2011_GWA1_46_21]KKU50826.1 MAG: hypothetical protein UX73_C0013G0003 [candidate division WWE3 bacterium GW2011_GWC1_47_10]KKU57679.1 MAG: hypothetical protein UX79_C0006G0015 [candidate division WWE3 bacterium GW2011_GWB1_47_11]
MFSKILVKLVDQAIVPALLLIAARILSVALISYRLGIELTINSFSLVLPDKESLLTVNSYSVLAMVSVLSVGLFYVLLKSYIFHDTHITPAMTAKVFTLRLSTFIQSSFDLYSQGVVWLSYLYLLTLVSGVLVFSGLLHVWVLVVAGVFSTMATYLLVLDVEREFAFSKSYKKRQPANEFVLNLEDMDD